MKVDRSKELLHPHPTLTSAPSLTLIAFDIFPFFLFPSYQFFFVYLQSIVELNEDREIRQGNNKYIK
jgi:hypothetical protein